MTEELINNLFRDIDASFIVGTDNQIIKTIVYNHLKDLILVKSPKEPNIIFSEKDNHEM